MNLLAAHVITAEMRALAAMLSFACGCGRIGFVVCPGCDDGTDGARDSGVDVGSDSSDSGSTGIKQVQIFAPGSRQAPLTFSVDKIAGDFMIAATYASNGANSVSDSLGETWMSLPGESFSCPGSAVFSLRLFYAQLRFTGANSITIAKESPDSGVGGLLIEYSGVARTNPIDSSSGELGGTATADFDAGALQLTASAQVVAAFAFSANATLAPGAGMQVQAHDDSFKAMIEDAPAPAGTFTATATLPSSMTTACWVGASVALRAE